MKVEDKAGYLGVVFGAVAKAIDIEQFGHAVSSPGFSNLQDGFRTLIPIAAGYLAGYFIGKIVFKNSSQPKNEM